MQFLIDTATDQPAELYRIGKFLVDNYATAPVAPRYVSDETQGTGGEDTIIMPAAEAREVRAAAIAQAVPPPPQPVFPGTPSSVALDNDPEVTIDDDGAVQSVAAVVELPAAPPPPPAPLFSVPPPPVPAPPGPLVTAERDSRGRPWDARIHAANRAKKIDGSWKTKRGVDATLVAQIEGSVPGNTPTAAPVLPMTGAQAEAISFGHLAAPPPPPAPTAPAATATAPIDFRGLMQKIQFLTAHGKLTVDQVNAVLAGVGLKPEEMAQLINNAPLIASVNAAVDKCTSP